MTNIKFNPIHVILALAWLMTVTSAVGSFIFDLKELNVVVGLAGFVYIVILIWTLIRKKPFSSDLPDMDFLVTPRIKFGLAVMGLLFAIGIVFIIGLMIGTATSLISVSAIIAAAITLSWRNQLKKQTIWIGIAFSLIAGLGILFLGNGDFSWAIFNFVTILPLFAGGALLIRRTSLANVRLLQGRYALGLKGFLWACILALPASLFNLLGNMQQSDIWVIHWWQPLYAIVPGIAEETWARLFFTTLCYAILRPTDNQHPRRAIVISILAGALVHSFAHTGINPLGLLIGGLLYFIPAALLFIKYDLEHAIGYHFLIDFVRFAAALLQN
jgi:hypothetical protein